MVVLASSRLDVSLCAGMLVQQARRLAAAW